MSLLGVRLTMLIGPVLPVPAPFELTEALTSVEVTHSDGGPSGFQLTFQAGRSGPLDLVDYPLLLNPLLLKPFNRVVLVVTFDVLPQVIMDGIITQVQLAPNEQPGASTISVMGEDVSVLMDMDDKITPHPSMDDFARVNRVLLPYLGRFQMIPVVLPTIFSKFPSPTEEIPVQTTTDREYLKRLAQRHGYVFFVKPGPAPLTNVAYWGPPVRTGLPPPIGPMTFPQKTLSVNMGPGSNVESVSFHNDALAPTMLRGIIQDAKTNVPLPVFSLPLSTRVPLVPFPALLFNQPNVRLKHLDVTPVEAAMKGKDPHANSAQGLDLPDAMARAQAQQEESTDRVVTASGTLDALQYGAVLESRGIVGLRGAGFTYDGFYYVNSVTHSIRKGEYKQSFNLSREGTGSLSPVLPP